jgi:hypothetical protein
MPNRKGSAPRQGGAQQTASAKTTRNSVPESSQPVLGDRLDYACQWCAHKADATYRVDRFTKTPHWFVGNSWAGRADGTCPQGGECLNAHCEWLSDLGIEVTPEQLLTDPRSSLLAAGARAQRHDRPPPPLPGDGTIGGWHSALLEEQNAAALNYLLGRGMSVEIIERYQIGWDRDRQRLTFPMPGGLLKTREPWDGAQMKCWPGKDRPWPLYPELPDGHGWLLLLAGELDALAGISVDLPAVSVTLGAEAWKPEWTDELRDTGKPVAVCFDNNETRLALWRVKQLNKAGVRAKHLDLRDLGLDEPKGDLSDYLQNGGDPKRIKLPRRKTK